MAAVRAYCGASKYSQYSCIPATKRIETERKLDEEFRIPQDEETQNVGPEAQELYRKYMSGELDQA